MPYESKGEPVVHDKVPLPGKTKLLLFRILIFFFQAFQVVLFCWVLVLFYYFFYLNIHFFVSFYPRQEQEGYSCGMTEILT